MTADKARAVLREELPKLERWEESLRCSGYPTDRDNAERLREKVFPALRVVAQPEEERHG